jgi:hypothetical protein
MILDPAHQSQCIFGLYEREAQRWLPVLAHGARSALDIGSSTGEYTLYFLARTDAEQVLAFDPDPVTRKDFLANLALNGLATNPRLRTCPQYVRATEGQDAFTLDGLLPLLELPCVIKIDVDGGEVDILTGADAMLQTNQVRWLIETHSRDLEDKCAALLSRHGYRVTIIRNAWWRAIVPEHRPTPHNRWLAAVPAGPLNRAC